MSRKIAREELFKLVFESELNDDSILDIVERYLGDEDYAEKLEEVSSLKGQEEFIKSYARGIFANNLLIEEKLNENMTGWTLSRVGTVERALLKFGAYELLFEETGHEIVLNEVIELAKKYGEDKSHEFINGVLAKLI